jgi:hypothetical protein
MDYRLNRREFLIGATALSMVPSIDAQEHQKKELIASLHNHTPAYNATYDAEKVGWKSVIDMAFRKGIDVVAITDGNKDIAFDNLVHFHTDILGPDYRVTNLGGRVAEIISPEGNVLDFVRGTEYYSHRDGHIISIGHNRSTQIHKNTRYFPGDVVNHIHSLGGIAIYSDTFIECDFLNALGGVGESRLKSLLEAGCIPDALEWNARLAMEDDTRGLNERAKTFGLENNLPVIATAGALNAESIDAGYFLVSSETYDRSSGTSRVESLRLAISKSNSPDMYTRLNRENTMSFERKGIVDSLDSGWRSVWTHRYDIMMVGLAVYLGIKMIMKRNKHKTKAITDEEKRVVN